VLQPSHNCGWAASCDLHTFNARVPHNWCTVGEENLHYISGLHFLAQTVMSSISWNSNVFCPGLSTICSSLLCTPYISSPFNYIHTRILQSSTLTERLQYSEVKHFHKKGDKQLTNYRPISLLTTFLKIVEKVMFNRLMINLNKYGIINPSQYS
jgi:hypothetical protein